MPIQTNKIITAMLLGPSNLVRNLPDLSTIGNTIEDLTEETIKELKNHCYGVEKEKVTKAFLLYFAFEWYKNKIVSLDRANIFIWILQAYRVASPNLHLEGVARLAKEIEKLVSDHTVTTELTALSGLTKNPMLALKKLHHVLSQAKEFIHIQQLEVQTIENLKSQKQLDALVHSERMNIESHALLGNPSTAPKVKKSGYIESNHFSPPRNSANGAAPIIEVARNGLN